MLDRGSFSKPTNLAEAASRLRKNAAYFRINYLVVILLTVAATFLTHPSSLVVLGGLAASWVYVFALRSSPLVISGRELRCEERPAREKTVLGGREGGVQHLYKEGRGTAHVASAVAASPPANTTCHPSLLQ